MNNTGEPHLDDAVSELVPGAAPDTAAAERLAAEMTAQADSARRRMGAMQHHMLDVVDALRAIEASADSDELEEEADSAPGAGGAERARNTDRDREPMVTATVNGEGALVGLAFSAAALRRPHTEIERLVVAVAGRAAVKAAMAHAEVMRRAGLVREPNAAE